MCCDLICTIINVSNHLTCKLISNSNTSQTKWWIDVEWSSSDPNIADISSSGEVIAMIEGATEISASSNGISASKEIAVSNTRRKILSEMFTSST